MKILRYIYINIVVLALASCVKEDIGVDVPIPSNSVEDGIAPSVIVPNDLLGSAPQTKSLVGANTNLSFASNFLRVDEVIESGTGNGTYTFNAWNTSTVMEGQAASPDNSANKLRALTLVPTQTYRIKGEKLSDNQYRIDNYYHTRMVGWYPQTCQLRTNADGKKVATGIDAARNSDGEKIYSVEGGRTYIHFKDLGINRDVMMTDMREAQQWHSAGSNAASDFIDNGATSVYRHPFGEYTGTPSYLNYFTFHHYRSAIRLYVEADQSEQNLSMWGTIINVRILNQPTACKIRVPETVGAFADYANDGDIVWDEDSADDFSINTDAMFSGDPSRDNLNQKVTYPVELDGATSANRVYLGYALIQPNTPVDIELHTTSGIYSVTLKSTITDKDGNPVREVLNAGTFYNVTMSLQTKGAITEILESNGDEIFYDLSKEQTFEGSEEYSGLRYANCYIVDPKDKHVIDALTEYLDRINADVDDANKVSKTRYDGFAFCATVVGNGEAGIISNNFTPNKSIISPYSARLIWETTPGLVTNIDLIHGYVRFKVKYADANSNTTVKGNALIGVYDKDNKILWSWHVWITDTPAEVELSGSKFLDRNVGATVAVPADGDQALLSYGLYYQWGRKDPSMYPPSYDYAIKSLITSPYYDYAKEEKNATEVRQYAQPTLRNGIDFPQFLLLPTNRTGGNYAYNWMYENDTDLWGEHDGTVEKTIYDPCPYGYRVPGGEFKNALDDISSSATKNGYGWTSGSFFLPYTGFKGDDMNSNSMTCAWKDVGSRGDYQTARTQTSNTDRFHRERLFISKTQTWSYWVGDAEQSYGGYYKAYYTNRRTGAPVRCVKDENMAGVIDAQIQIKHSDNYKDVGAVLIADEELSITCSATTTGNSSITSLSLKLNYEYDGEEKSVTIASISGNFGTSVQRTWSFTVEDKEYLSHILESGYTFSVVATNNLGRKGSGSAQLRRYVLRITGLDAESVRVGVDKTRQLTPTTVPDTVPDGAVVYESADETIASVSSTGIVRGEALGDTEITASIPSTNEYTGVGSITIPVSVVIPTTNVSFSSPWYVSNANDGRVYAYGTGVEFYFELNDPNSLVQTLRITIDGKGIDTIERLGETPNGTLYKATYTCWLTTGDHTVTVSALDGSSSELDYDSRILTVEDPVVDLKLVEGDFFNVDTKTFTVYVRVGGISYSNYLSGVHLIVGTQDYWVARPQTAESVVVDGETYYKYKYTLQNDLPVGHYEAQAYAKENAWEAESNTLEFDFRYKYWVKATSASELDGKLIVIVNNNKMIRNSANNNSAPALNGTFDPNSLNQDNYTYSVITNSDGSYSFASRANTNNKLRRNNGNLRIGSDNNATANWTLNYNDGSFTIRNESPNNYIFWTSYHYLSVSGNNASVNEYSGSSFEIWYLDFEVTFDHAVNGVATGAYVYDNNGTVALSAPESLPSYWRVVDYYNGAYTLQNSSTYSYIAFAAQGENPQITGNKPNVNVSFDVENRAAQNVAVKQGTSTVYFYNWENQSSRFGFWGTANDYFIVTAY